MPQTVESRIREWSRSTDDEHLRTLFEGLDFVAHHLFEEYHPTAGPGLDFWARCAMWLDSAADEDDQKILFELISHILFVSSGQFHALARAALNEHVVRWLMDLVPLDLEDLLITDRLQEEFRHTWFGSITDSMQIASYYHVNGLTGRDFRPEWRSLQQFGDPNKIEKYMQDNEIRRIVLLEDFVGSGSQMESAVTFAATLPSRLPVLVVPLLICPDGERAGARLSQGQYNVTFSPVLVLPEDSLLGPVATVGEPPLFDRVRDLITRLEPLVRGVSSAETYYTRYGYPMPDGTGALVVLYSNCPDNTLPVIHRRSSSWSPLFPRSTRI